MGFARRLKELRERMGMSQESLARAAGISVSSVSKLEQRADQDPAWSTVQAIARALGVDCTAFSDCEDVKGESQEEEKPAGKAKKKDKDKK